MKNPECYRKYSEKRDKEKVHGLLELHESLEDSWNKCNSWTPKHTGVCVRKSAVI